MSKHRKPYKRTPTFKAQRKVESFALSVEELRENDTRFIVSLGIAGKVIDLVNTGHRHNPEDLPRETASFLIVRCMDDGQEKIGLDIYSQPFCVYATQTATTKLLGTRYLIPDGPSPIPEYVDDLSLEAIRGVAATRPLLIKPPLFTTH